MDTFKKHRDEGKEYVKNLTDSQIEQMVNDQYSPPRRWGRQIGIETWGYDGISYYECPDCKSVFDRFTNQEVSKCHYAPIVHKLNDDICSQCNVVLHSHKITIKLGK